MDFRSTPCLFLGYSPLHHGYRCLDLSSERIYIARHVRFDESSFPFYNINTSTSSPISSKSPYTSMVSPHEMPDALPLSTHTDPPLSVDHPSSTPNNTSNLVDPPSQTQSTGPPPLLYLPLVLVLPTFSKTQNSVFLSILPPITLSPTYPNRHHSLLRINLQNGVRQWRMSIVLL